MRPSRYPLTCFFAPLFVTQIVGTILFSYFPFSLLPYTFWPYLASPSLIGLLMILWLEGPPGILNLLRKLAPWATGEAWPMLAVCVLLPLACLPLALALLASSGTVPSLWNANLPAYFYAAFIGKGLLGHGIYEEIGWRGFVLPRLQRHHSALASSIIIGIVWAFWHVPYFVYEYPFPWRFVALFIPEVISFAIIFTWVYNTTHGNLFAVILLHGAINARQFLFDWQMPDTAKTQIMADIPFYLIAICLVWRYGPSNLSCCKRIQAPPLELLN
jgi:membrane protease YdiL (CAAX protease family)